jgi:RNA polymerase sigma-70 factor (ECF subfamily)
MSARHSIDTAALAATELDARFRGPLMSFFVRRVRDRGEAEDLTQQTFVRLLGARDRSQIENAAAFVFQVATNLLKDRRRAIASRGGDRGYSLDDQEGGHVPHQLAEGPTPERVLLGREALAGAMASLGELDARTRHIFILFRLENLRQQEIADRLGISRSTVEKHVMKASLHLARTHGTR